MINKQLVFIDNAPGVKKTWRWGLDSVLKQIGRKIDDYIIWENVTPDSLRVRLSNFKPNIIVPLGAEALEVATGKPHISKWRGSLIQHESGTKVLPMFHHSVLCKGGRTKDKVPIRPIMVWDLKKAFRYSQTPEYELLERQRITNPIVQEIEDFINDTINNKRPIAVDIETSGRQIDCIGIASSATDSMCIPFEGLEYGDHLYFSKQRNYVIWSMLRELMLHKDVEKIFQNGAYDIPWLEERYQCQVNNYAFDTYVGMKTVYAEMPAGLDFQCSIFTDIPYYKDQIQDNRWVYNCNDVLVTWESHKKLKNEIAYYELQEQMEHQMNVYRTMIKVSRRGLLFDQEKAKAMLEASVSQLAKWRTEADEIVGSEINLQSPPQIKDYLYGTCKMKEVKEKGKVTTNANAIQKLQKKYPKNKFLPILAKHRRLAKLVSTYLAPTLDDDGRVRSMFGLTETGRLTSSTSPFWTGMNLQNIPRNDKAITLDE